MFVMPFLFQPFTPPPEETDSGAGSGQSGQEPWLCSYSDWFNMFCGDNDGDGTIGTKSDYYTWFTVDMGCTDEDLWYKLNGPDYPFSPN